MGRELRRRATLYCKWRLNLLRGGLRRVGRDSAFVDHAQQFAHFFVEETFARAVRLYPLAVNYELGIARLPVRRITSSAAPGVA
jgi:hypothetical protein